MDKAIQKMIRGFRHFRKTYFSDEPALYDQLKHGQVPSTLMIACCDSRVDPALITKSSPGDMFVIRNVANLVPPYKPDSSTFSGSQTHHCAWALQLRRYPRPDVR